MVNFQIKSIVEGEEVRLLEELTLHQKEYFLSNAKTLNYNDIDALVVEAQQKCDHVFFILEGSIKTFVVEDDKEHIGIILHKGDIFGECALFNREYYSYNAGVLEEKTRVMAVHHSVLKELMKDNFQFNMKIIGKIGQKIAMNEERLFDFATKDARQRILEFLKKNVENNGKKIGFETLIKHGLTQQDIATFTGTSRQTVTTVLNDLKNKNKIHLRRKSILIRDLAALV